MNVTDYKYIDFMRNNPKLFGEYYADADNELGEVKPEVIKALKKFTNKLYNVLIQEVEVKFVDYEPYDYLKDGFTDMIKDYENGFIRVPTLSDDSDIFGDYNLKFRASHDIIHCLINKSFSYEDEFETFIYTTRLFKIWNEDLYDAEVDIAIRVIRSEIIYQSAYKNFITENSIEQKVVLSDPEK